MKASPTVRILIIVVGLALCVLGVMWFKMNDAVPFVATVATSTARRAADIVVVKKSPRTPESATTTALKTISRATYDESSIGLPVRLQIPKLKVDAGFQDVGLTASGTMEVPTTITEAGWFTGSVRPGEKGTSVIAGHVAQIRGGVATKPGIFFYLSTLVPGDIISVLNDRGTEIKYVVRESRLFDPAADGTAIFRSNDGGIHLSLITCDGTWDAMKHSYSQRLVVFADALK